MFEQVQFLFQWALSLIVSDPDGQNPVLLTSDGQSIPIKRPFGRAALYAIQVEEGAAHRGWVQLTTAPDDFEAAVKAAELAGLTLVDVNVAGAGIEGFLIRGASAQHHFGRYTGRRFPAGGSHGKHANKRERVLKLVGLGTGQGGTAYRGQATTATENGYTVHTIELPQSESLRAVEVPCPWNANDNDALITQGGLDKMARLLDLTVSDEHHVAQLVIKGPTGALKFAGQILRGEATGATADLLAAAPEADLYLGAAGVDRKSQTTGFIEIRAELWREETQSGLVPYDGLQQARTVFGYLEPDTVARYSEAIINVLVRQDQLAAMGQKRLPRHEPDETPLDYQIRCLLEQAHWAWQASKAHTVGAVAWEANGSPFAWPDRQDRSRRVARKIAAMVKKNRRGKKGGMPSGLLPGFWVKFMSPHFVGDVHDPVTEPPRGWLQLVWRRHNQPGGFVINRRDFATQWFYRLYDGSDGDDKFTATLVVDAALNPYILLLRRPGSPFNGALWRITKDQAREYQTRTGIPAMPLRATWAEWQAQCLRYAELPESISRGPEREPEPPTNDLAQAIPACIWQAKQVPLTGKTSMLISAIYNSRLADNGEAVFAASDLIDNSVEGYCDGNYIYQGFCDFLLQQIEQGQSFWPPAVAVIHQDLAAKYQERHGKWPNFRFHSDREFDRAWRNLVAFSDRLQHTAQSLAARQNGPYQYLIVNFPAPVTAAARKTVKQAASVWQHWGTRQESIRQTPYEFRSARKSQATGAALAALERSVLAGYEIAGQTPGYGPGMFAAALWQAQLTEPRAWQTGKQRYELMPYLPKEELIGFFQRPELSEGADPTWIARIYGPPDCVQPWDEVTVHRVGGAYYLFKDANEAALARLGSEAYGLVGLTAEFVGYVPASERLPDSGRVAVFRNSGNELYQQTATLLAEARRDLESHRVCV